MINKDMTIGEVLKVDRNLAATLMEFGMGCVGCPSAQAETIAEAASVHGVNVEILVNELNEAEGK
jgi:hybrid cluster-associated redox disulfide protein